MKITAFILLVFSLNLGAKTTAQERITLKEKGASLLRIFSEIQKQAGYNFFFSEESLKTGKPVDIDVKNASVKEVLDICFKNQPFTYTLTRNVITIVPKAEQRSTREFDVDINISGKVLDKDGNPLAGANVKIKGTSIATMTDANGNFSLKGVDENATLEVSFVGHETQLVNIKGKASISINLAQKTSVLDETVVIAYGTTTRRLNTGNISTVKSSEIEKQPVNNPLLALQGRVPGILITQNTGVPGGGITVRLQGQNSLSRGSDPLYIIDGVPYISQLLPNISTDAGILGPNGNTNPTYSPGGGGNPLSFINPQDIESIDILKDADATAIYGSLAANGAIIITTKKGKAGKTNFDINVQNGWGKVTRKLDLLNTEQYIAMRKEAYANDNLPLPSIVTSPSNTNYDINGAWDTERYTDWQKELIGGTANYLDAHATLSGGTQSTNFLFGGGYHRETTVFPGDLNDQKGSMHISVRHQSSNQRLQMQLNGNYMVDNNQLIQNDLTRTSLLLPPNAPALYKDDGTLNWEQLPNGNSTWINPLSYFYNKYKIKTNNLLVSSSISYMIIKGLEIKGNFGYNNLQSNETNIYPLLSTAPERRASTLRRSLYQKNSITSWNIEPQLTYKTGIGKGKLEGLVGATLREVNSDGQQLYGEGHNSDLVLEDIRSASLVSVYSTLSSEYKYRAVFGRLNYNLQNKYIVNVGVRRDGSSRFGSANLFHNFWSIAGAWIFSGEKFMQGSLPVMSYGKLRASYGTTGNDQIGDYQFMNLYRPYNVNVAYGDAASLEPVGLPNIHLQWEETKKMQFGLDMGFFRDKLLLNINYYHNRSSNLLESYTLPIITGSSSIQSNFPATIQNYGWEFSLNTINLESKKFSWRSNVNITFPRNKLVAFPNLETSSYATTLVIGEPITIAKSFHLTGVDQNTGLYSFEDIHGNSTSLPSIPTDATVLVNVDPRFYGGFQNTFKFKDFELDVLIQGTRQTALNYYLGNRPGRFVFSRVTGVSGNQPVYVLDRWQKSGDISAHQKFSATYPSDVGTPYSSALVSDAAYSDASYLRLKNISFSWWLPDSWRKFAHLSNARIYLQGQNLFTITNYQGLDPENTSVLRLPPLKVWTFGVNVGL